MMNSLNGLGTSKQINQPPAAAEDPLITQLISKDLDPSLRSKLVKDLGDLDKPMLQRLHADGVRFVSTDNQTRDDGTRKAGAFDPLSKKIKLDREYYLTEGGRETLYHEIGHAIDFGRVSKADTVVKKLGALLFSVSREKQKVSESNPQLDAIYQNFQARTFGQLATEVRDTVYKDESIRISEKLEAKSFKTAMLGQGVFIHQPGAKKDAVVFQTEQHRVRNGWLKVGGGAAALVAAAATGGIAAVVVGGVGLGSLILGGLDLLTRPVPWKQSVGGMSVDHQESATTILLDKGDSSQTIGWTSDYSYIASANQKEELFAEAVSGYLTSPETRQQLRQQDPDLFQLVESAIKDYKVVS
jgi:hypothetical protein